MRTVRTDRAKIAAQGGMTRKARFPEALIVALLAASVSLLASRCGSEIGNPKQPTTGSGAGGTSGTTGKSSIAATDSGVGTQTVGAQLDETLLALNDTTGSNSGSTATSLALDLAGGTVSSTCVPAASGAVDVTVTRAGDFSTTLQRLIGLVVTQITSNDTLKFHWSRAGATLACNAAGTNAVLDGRSADGLTLGETMSINDARQTTLTTRAGRVFSTSSSTTSSGTRSLVWTKKPVDASTSVRTYERAIGFNISRASTLKDAKGVTHVVESAISTTSPMTTEIDHDATTGAVGARRLVSGRILSQLKDGVTLETSYSNVVLQQSTDCVPESGDVSGTMTSTTDGSTILTYSVTFAQGVASVTFSGGGYSGTVGTYVPEGCKGQ